MNRKNFFLGLLAVPIALLASKKTNAEPKPPAIEPVVKPTIPYSGVDWAEGKSRTVFTPVCGCSGPTDYCICKSRQRGRRIIATMYDEWDNWKDVELPPDWQDKIVESVAEKLKKS